jgi:hypothetical protein
VNAARAGLVHVGMSSAHPIAITAGTDGTLYMSGLADDPIEIVTWTEPGRTASAWLDGVGGLVAVGPTPRDAADALRGLLLDGISKPEGLFRVLAEKASAVVLSDDDVVDGTDRAVAAAEGQAYLTAARILFAAKQVALHEAERHTAQREAAYKAGQS